MAKVLESYRGWRRRQKLVFWTVVGVVVYTVCGFLVAPPILKAVLEKKLPELLHRPVSIATIHLNPYALSATIEGFSVGQRDGAGEMVGFDRLYLNLEASSLLRRALIISRLTLEGPRLDVARVSEESFSFSDLLPASAPVADGAEKSEPAHFSVNNIEISGGALTYRDQPKEVTHQVTGLTLNVPTISNLPTRVNLFVQPRFSATINGTPVNVAGESKPFADSLETDINLQMAGFQVPGYLVYLPNLPGMNIRSALLDIDTKLVYLVREDQTTSLSLTGTLALRELDVAEVGGESALQIPRISVRFDNSDLLVKELRLAEVAIEQPHLVLDRGPDGRLLRLALQSLTEANEAEAQPEAGNAEPVRVTLDRFRLEQGTVEFHDRALATPCDLRYDQVNLMAEGLSTIPSARGTLALDLLINRAGRLHFEGDMSLIPLDLKAKLSLEALPLRDFQPYLAEQAQVVLADGQFDLQGDLTLNAAEGTEPVLTFSGDSAVRQLATADARGGADLLKWQALQFGQIRVVSQPLEVAVAEVKLVKPSFNVQVFDDGSLNLASLAKQPPPGTAVEDAAEAVAGDSPTGSDAAPLPKVAINKVVISDGSLQFRDNNIQPNYGITLDKFGGTISGLSSAVDSQARLDLSARIDKQAPLAITGTLNPLSVEPFFDITVDFKNFNLTPLSPYTGKYIGYKTGKGKLNLDLHYQVAERQLDSSNQVFLDQFTLGETVDSPDATSLPVSLAIALLKDRSGEIHLDIPVAGDLDDPEFSVGGVIVQVVVNLIAKAATSPFALLGALIPEGEDIEHIPFAAGSADLGAEALGKLETVARVLQERPGLNMELAGRIDAAADRQALALAQLQQLVRLEKLQAGGKKPKQEGQTVNVSAEEYPVYLEAAYRKALKQAPAEVRKAEAERKPATPAEAQAQMEAFLLGGIRVSDEDLRLLAIDRANAVAGQLSSAGGVEAGRLFAVEPQLEAVTGEGAENAAQVQLLIK